MLLLLIWAAAAKVPEVASSNFPGWITAALAVFGLIGFIVTAWNFGNRKRDKDTMDSQDRLLKALRDEMVAERSHCNERIARLEGQVQTMIPDFAREIGKALLQSMPQFVEAVERAVRHE